MRRHALVAAVAIFSAAAVAPARAETKRVYHVGNSVTDTINYGGLDAMATGRGHDHQWGRHMIPGAPLSWIWEHPADGFQEGPYGYYPDALPNYTWDAITLQPFDRLIQGDGNDKQMASNFIDRALQNPANKDTQFYIYSRWPRRDESGGNYPPFDYQQKWDRAFTGGWDGSNESRDFFQDLLGELRGVYNTGPNPLLNKTILMVPVGDVLYELDQRMEGGLVPGFTDVVELYSDGIHFTNVGSFLVGTTFFATLYGEDPNGLAVPAQYGSIPAPLAAAIQDVVWDVVTGHPYSGVAEVPEPATALMLGGAALLAIRRRRR